MKYKVAVEVKTKIFVEVEADNFEHARIKAESAAYNYDFGVVKDIDTAAIEAVDENGSEEYF